jgi:hypothetical protein
MWLPDSAGNLHRSAYQRALTGIYQQFNVTGI